jgi:tetratricopeptide (TPR) repeat protein
MVKNPWFTLVIGLMAGLALGYVLAERQSIPPGKALRRGMVPPTNPAADLPEGHPPIGQGEGMSPEARRFGEQIAEMETLLAQNPGDTGLMVALGNANFDAQRWQEARMWYERALGDERNVNPDVITDLAVVYRNLKQPKRSLELLERAISLDDDHWQAWYNKVVVMHFDLHDHDGARRALDRLQVIAAGNPQVPDLEPIRREVMGS